MRAGELVERIRIESPVTSDPNTQGEVETRWILFARTWARMWNVRGREGITQSGEVGARMWIVRTRAMDQVTSAMRIVTRRRVLAIISVELQRERGIMDLYCREVEV